VEGATAYHIIWNTTLDDIPIGETSTLIVPWPQTGSDDDPGDKDIRVNVSLDMDYNPDNNEVTAKINIRRKDILPEFDFSVLALPIISLVFLLCIIALVITKVRKKEGREGK